MDQFAYYMLDGLCYGAILALIALGYTLVYGIIKLINFAHGEFYMVGAYAGFFAFSWWFAQSPWWLALPLILLISGAAGAGIAATTEWIAYKPIRTSGRLAALLTAIGVSFFLQKLATFIRDGKTQMYPVAPGSLGELAQQPVKIGGSGIEIVKFVYLGIALALTALLWFIVMRTRFGRAMRAVSQDRDAAALMGVDINGVIRTTFLLGGFLAGVAGTLVGLLYGANPTMGFLPGLNAFIAAVVGGIGSIPGAVLGGFLIGIVQNLVLFVGIPTDYKHVAAFVVLIAVLVIRPQGILGQAEREKV